MTRRLVGYVVAAAVVLAGALYVLGRWDGAIAARDAESIRSARQVLATSKAWRQQQAARRDSIEAFRAAARRERLRRHAVEDTLKQASAALAAAVAGGAAVPPQATQVIEIQHAVIHACQRELVLAWRADSTCAVRADSAEARVAQLEASTASLLAVKDCRFLFLRCPSRTTVAVVSVAAGVVGGVYIGVKMVR